MEINDVPIQHIGHCGHHIEVSAVVIGGQWYPLLRVLNRNFQQTYAWQVLATDGFDHSEQAIDAATLRGRELIDTAR